MRGHRAIEGCTIDLSLQVLAIPEYVLAVRPPCKPRHCKTICLGYKISRSPHRAASVSCESTPLEPPHAADTRSSGLYRTGQIDRVAGEWRRLPAHWRWPRGTAGCDLRSSKHGCSPMLFVKQVRMRHAKAMLTTPEAGTSVTSVAFACGFSNLGHFAKDYFQGFGELPSETLRAKKGSRAI
ncbi:MAG: helix-turn-helix domain-containing protein [Methyloceanibacter sp.]